MDNISAASKLRQKYKHFRILVIGRANAGKTTLLKRVCNTTEEPCIYDKQNNNLIHLDPLYQRGTHDVNRPFAFKSNPQFIFHDSPGFEAGGVEELNKVQQFIEKHAKATEVKDQLHVIWFCFRPDISRPLLDLEKQFFNKHAKNVPVIAIYTKFDDLVSQVYDPEREEEENHQYAIFCLRDKFEQPLDKCEFPPKAHLHLEGIPWTDMQKNDGNHQEQVQKLIQKTADSLDNLAIEMLFVSVQQNNLELCIKYAIK
ncbi:hypothetical protein K435DRAFT_823875 [Dendrothele bispora CBS 962.96]|uniref:G domain-containing protein n=1 Tax=Dendrothele bispora (strain CBS 962.96) TaxID=1314807 RepID=A0A4S8KUJ5_DENBC|nr:hypothetical protein K435DRAFT_823875 [Dendrothele bispora CBS 962.96]